MSRSLICCCVRVLCGAPGCACCLRVQESCKQCGQPTTVKPADRHHLCPSCKHQRYYTSSTAAAASPPSAPSPLFPSHAGSHARLSLLRRAAIVILDKQGATRGEIAQQVGASAPSVRHWIPHDEEKDEFADEHRSGRPRSTDEAMDTAIVGESYNDHFATPRTLKRRLELEDVSVRTIARRLDEAGLHGRVARHTFRLTDDHKRQRLSFAEGYQRWTEDDWCRVIFSDEKTFPGEGGGGRIWVRRPVDEASNPDYSVPEKPHPIAQPAWGCFSAQGPGYMAMFDGSLDGPRLRNILREYLLPTFNEQFPDAPTRWFLWDNDPGRHLSRLVKQCIHNNGITCLEFPPYSPDLNPIENLWADMVKRMESKPARTSEQLEALVQQTWAETTTEQCSKLARSMTHRIAQVIDRGGA